jgi:hypothetical protein
LPRIELLMSLLAGLAGGLTGVLWSGLVSSPWIARHRNRWRGNWRTESLAQLVAGAALYAAAGAALGFLYWLGWGLIALVNFPWYATGLLFGLLCWTATAVPVLGSLALRLREFTPVAIVHAVEWLVACLAAGLFCALSWHRYA